MDDSTEDVRTFLQALGLDDASLGAAADGEALFGLNGPNPDQTTAPQAINELGEMFRMLQLQAHRIFNIFGTSAPCDVIASHNAAVAAYMQAATSVFADITKQGGQITQQLYDFDGNLTGQQKGSSPVAPAYFEPCRGQAQPVPSAVDGAFYGVPFGETRLISSIGDVAYNPGGLGIFPIIAVVVIIVAGITATAIVYVIVHRPQTAIDQVKAQGVWMDNYMTCVENMLKVDPKLGSAAADARCRGLTAPPKPDAPGDGFPIGTVLIALGLAAIGGYLIYQAMQRRKLGPFAPQPVQALTGWGGYVFDGDSAEPPPTAGERCCPCP